MRITIAGGGNIGTQFAVHCAEKGHDVTVFTSTPDIFENCLNIVDERGNITHKGWIKQATSDPETAFKMADLILITVPATVMDRISRLVFSNSSSSSVIGVVPGNGGCECLFRNCIERGNVIFGLQRVPAIARLVDKGKTVRSTGYRDELYVSAIPDDRSKECAGIIESIFDIKTICMPCFLNLTMAPSNPILHTTRLRTIYKDWCEGVFYDNLPLFYEEWDNESSELLLACDSEVQEVCKALSDFDLRYVKSLKLHYECDTVETMTAKISSIEAFKGLTTPAVKTEDGFIPDLNSRYFTADFSYGLSIIKQIADFAGVKTPNIDETMEWYSKIAVEKSGFRYENYGISSYDEFVEFYKR